MFCPWENSHSALEGVIFFFSGAVLSECDMNPHHVYEFFFLIIPLGDSVSVESQFGVLELRRLRQHPEVRIQGPESHGCHQHLHQNAAKENQCFASAVKMQTIPGD